MTVDLLIATILAFLGFRLLYFARKNIYVRLGCWFVVSGPILIGIGCFISISTIIGMTSIILVITAIIGAVVITAIGVYVFGRIIPKC